MARSNNSDSVIPLSIALCLAFFNMSGSILIVVGIFFINHNIYYCTTINMSSNIVIYMTTHNVGIFYKLKYDYTDHKKMNIFDLDEGVPARRISSTGKYFIQLTFNLVLFNVEYVNTHLIRNFALAKRKYHKQPILIFVD